MKTLAWVRGWCRPPTFGRAARPAAATSSSSGTCWSRSVTLSQPLGQRPPLAPTVRWEVTVSLLFAGQVSRGRLEREHHRALPQRAGCNGQQQLPRQLRCGRAGRTCGIQPGGTTQLQVCASPESSESSLCCFLMPRHICWQADSRHRKIRWHCRHPTQGSGIQPAQPADQLHGAGHPEALRFGVTDYNHLEEVLPSCRHLSVQRSTDLVIDSSPVLPGCQVSEAWRDALWFPWRRGWAWRCASLPCATGDPKLATLCGLASTRSPVSKLWSQQVFTPFAVCPITSCPDASQQRRLNVTCLARSVIGQFAFQIPNLILKYVNITLYIYSPQCVNKRCTLTLNQCSLPCSGIFHLFVIWISNLQCVMLRIQGILDYLTKSALYLLSWAELKDPKCTLKSICFRSTFLHKYFILILFISCMCFK